MKISTKISKKNWLIVAAAVSGMMVIILITCNQKQALEQRSTVTPSATVQTGIEIQHAAMAEGVIVPSRTVSLHFPNGGIVAEVLVNEGESVKTGQIIARQKGGDHIKALVSAAELQLLAARQEYEELIRYGTLQNAEARLALVQSTSARQDSLEKRLDAGFPRANSNRIDMAYADYILTLIDYEAAQKEFQAFENRAADDEERAERAVQLELARKRHDRALAVWNYYNSKADIQEKNEIEGLLAVADADVKSAEITLEYRKDGADTNRIELAQARLKMAQAALDDANAALDRLSMTAPMDGLVVVNPLRVGEYAAGQTQPVMLAGSSWQVKTTDLIELDITKIDIGQAVNIQVDAIPQCNLAGHVSSIEGIGSNIHGDMTYSITIDLDEEDERLLWNMTVFVIFDDKTG